jgi:hypothetical protein
MTPKSFRGEQKMIRKEIYTELSANIVQGHDIWGGKVTGTTVRTASSSTSQKQSVKTFNWNVQNFQVRTKAQTSKEIVESMMVCSSQKKKKKKKKNCLLTICSPKPTTFIFWNAYNNASNENDQIFGETSGFCNRIMYLPTQQFP